YQHLGWESLKEDIREAASNGCTAIFIDPITNLTNGMSAADANTKLQEIAQELAAMALDLNVVIFIFCHLKSPDSGPDHEHGGQVLSSQFAGSRAMMRSCNLMIGIEGDKSPELPLEQKNMRELVLLEDREFGNTGRFPLYWDQNRSEEHTSELQSRENIVCRLLLACCVSPRAFLSFPTRRSSDLSVEQPICRE